ncbi:MAG TPA: hypothetical protein VJC07_02255 [Candidatus Nanoarchaeia archaeon]|nr:hypothetical protein [Candidatus Nanoarchaeia archaeon]
MLSHPWGSLPITSAKWNADESILSGNTYWAAEVEALAKMIAQHAVTSTGTSTIEGALRFPLIDPAAIELKQDSLREIRGDKNLHRSLIDLLEQVRDKEGKAGTFLSGDWELLSDPYEGQATLRELFMALPNLAAELPEPATPYLQSLKKALTDVGGTRSHDFARFPVFRQYFKKGIRAPKELDFSSVPSVFCPTALKLIPGSIGGATAGYIGWLLMNNGNLNETTASGALVFAGLVGLIGSYIGNHWGLRRDRRRFLRPLREHFTTAPEALRAYDALGHLDELVAYEGFSHTLKQVVLPLVHDAEQHTFVARRLINATQSKKIEDYVPNDVAIGVDHRITVLTGPNSGGKTSLAKSIVHAQILAQSGCYVPADMAEISIADRIFYQVGRNDSLQDEEGGLGTQLKETKGTFEASTRRTLVAIDDLIEGTTFEEKTEQTTDMLCAFLHKGTNLVYVTHHYELAQWFERQGVGSYIQVEFNDGRPTYKIMPGISTNSHADAVARRVGFSPEDMLAHLQEQGYIKNGQVLRDIRRHARAKTS